jgi:hypothetical protein
MPRSRFALALCLLSALLASGCMRASSSSAIERDGSPADSPTWTPSDGASDGDIWIFRRDFTVDLAADLPTKASNGVNLQAVIGAPDLYLDKDAVLDTDAGTMGGGPFPGFVTINQGSDAPEIAVFTFDTVEMAANVTLRVRGSRALAIVARQVLISGTIDLSAGQDPNTPQRPGPGGFSGGTDAAPSALGPGGGKVGAIDGAVNEGGGGGGGYGSAGGDGGGGGGATQIGGAEGAPNGSADLQPLRGGGGGGCGAPGNNPSHTPGGGGGGALQITAVQTIRVDSTGGITAGGAGGAAGPAAAGGRGGGGGAGGGSGGAILLEAPLIELQGTLAVNGGGGGGAPHFAEQATAGSPGGLGTTPAAGGVPGTSEGAGGAGAAGTTAAEDGKTANANGGGGGGGIGRIALRAGLLDDKAATLSGGVTRVSPP